ncbi:MAG: FAD-dependent oxidoreductase [Truepera sp.]|nr:FAD-dependent oxidoreductase [Truepera sp.]
MAGHSYDLIVVGAGISGSEAAYACALRGLDTLLLSTSLDTVYMFPDGAVLNPPPGTLMAELHAKLADAWGYVGSLAWHRAAKGALERQTGLHLLQANAVALLTEGDAVRGVATWEGVDWLAPRVALCVGSFLQARLTIGSLTEAAGRLSEMAYDDLYHNLQAIGFTFVPERLEVPGSLPYRVEYQRFAPPQWNPVSFQLQPIAGLYAAGVCAAGYLPFEAAALHGRRLADVVVDMFWSA